MSKIKKIPPIIKPFYITPFSDDDYFDDCPICQAQKLADKENRSLSLSEYKEAALKAKKLGAVTGGILLDEDHI